MRVLDQYWCLFCEEVNGVTKKEWRTHMDFDHIGWRQGVLKHIPFRHERVHPSPVSNCVECLTLQLAARDAEIKVLKENQITEEGIEACQQSVDWYNGRIKQLESDLAAARRQLAEMTERASDKTQAAEGFEGMYEKSGQENARLVAALKVATDALTQIADCIEIIDDHAECYNKAKSALAELEKAK